MALEATDVAPGEGSDAAVEWAGGSVHQPEGGDGARELEPALACSALSVESP